MGNDVTKILLGQETQNEGQTTNDSEQKTYRQNQFIYDAKREDDANDLIGKVRPEFVVLVGLEDYGKTTFVGSLYHQFRSNGKIDRQLLVDSDTLTGFEYKVFLRVMNNEGVSDSLRTRSRDAFLLSLNLKDEKNGTERQLVLSDRAGETYYGYISDASLIEKDRTLSRADRVLLFVDSEKMLDDTEYLGMKDDYKMLLSRLLKAGKYPKDALLYVVFNKFDKVIKKKEKTYDLRKQEMLEIFKIIKEEPDGVFQVDSKSLNDAENKTDIWKLQKLLVNPLV